MLSRASSVLCLLSCLSTIRCHPPKVGKVYIYQASATSPTLIFTNSYFIDLHLPIPITYLAGYPPAHTPSGESLTDLIHRVTSGLIINILPYPCRPFHPPPLDLNDHRALYWNRLLFASFITETARIVSIHPGSAHPTCASPLSPESGIRSTTWPNVHCRPGSSPSMRPPIFCLCWPFLFFALHLEKYST